MATTTPNYGWTVPTSTDLVKDGATAIETLGDAIDASMNTALGTKKAGMVLLNTTSFSAVSSQSINDVFSATYTNYKIIVRSEITTGSDIGFRFRLRVSGSDASGSNYNNQLFQGSVTSTAVVQFNSETSWQTAGLNASSDQPNLQIIELNNPFLAKKTNHITQFFNPLGSAVGFLAGSHTLTTSYTGFTIFPASSTITGSVSVYGYNV
jgi:hypothetical protein